MTPKKKAKQLVDKYLIMIKFDSTYNLKWNDVSLSEESKKDHARATKDAKIYAIATADEVIEQEQQRLSFPQFWYLCRYRKLCYFQKE